MIRSGLRLTAAIVAALVLATGCTALKEEHQNVMNRRVDIVNVVGNIWRISGSWPNTQNAKPLTEHLYERAQRFCHDAEKGMMPVTGSSVDGAADGSKPATAWLEFRCENPQKVYREYKGITLHLDEFLEGDDEKRN